MANQNNSTWQDWKHYQDTARNQSQFGGFGTGMDIGRVIFGGPVGWYKAASGDRSFGGNYGNRLAHTDLANAPDGEAIFNAMTQAEHDAFENMNANQRAAFIEKKRKEVGEQGKVDEEEKEYQEWRAATMARLDKFAKEMSMSVPELLASGNLGVQQAQSAGLRAGGQQALAAGAGQGGLSTLNSQKAAMDSMNAYATQRQALGLQATQGLMAFDEGRRRYDIGQQLQMQAANIAAYNQQYQQKQQQQAGLLGLIGTGVGAYFGGPMGAQAGGQMGMAAGNYMYGQSNPYTPPTYQQPKSSPRTGMTGMYGNQQ